MLFSSRSISAGVALATSSPRSRHTTASFSMMVLILCAMVMIVRDANWSAITSCISLSVSRSTDAVASSRHTTLVSRSSARARHSICRCPALKFSPYSATGASSPTPCSVTAGLSCTASSANHSVSSECSLNGSRLSRTFPLNRIGSCGMHVTRDRRSFSVMFCTSTPSSVMLPPHGSTSRQSATMSVDLPEPVRPQMPTFSPARTSKETPRSTSGRPGRYRICVLRNWMAPALGQSGRTGLAPPRVAAPVASSDSSAAYSVMRSTETMLLSSSEMILMSHESKPVMSIAYESVRPTSAAYVLPRCHTPRHATTNVMELPMVSSRMGSHRSHPHFCV